MNTINYAQALADLEANLDRVADEVHDVLVREGLDEDQQHAAMQKAYRELDKAKTKAVAELDKVFSMVETRH